MLSREEIVNNETFILNTAKFAHEINKSYCESLGDHSQLSWEDSPDWVHASAISGVKFHVLNPESTPAQSHENWLKDKAADGWKYGPKKNPVLKEHPCFCPYRELPQEQRSKDYLFKCVVEQMIAIHSLY